MAKQKLTLDLVAEKLSSGVYKDPTNARSGILRSSLSPIDKTKAFKMIELHYSPVTPKIVRKNRTKPATALSFASIIVELGFDKCREIMHELRNKTGR